VAGPAQVHRSAGVTPPELAPGHLPAPHPPGLGARQEVVPGEAVPSDGPTAQLARPVGAVLEVFVVRSHPETIRLVRAGDVASLTRGGRSATRRPPQCAGLTSDTTRSVGNSRIARISPRCPCFPDRGEPSAPVHHGGAPEPRHGPLTAPVLTPCNLTAPGHAQGEPRPLTGRGERR
jgi:hypothetical protein